VRTLKLLGAVGLVILVFGGCLLLPCMQPEIRESTARTVSGWKLREITLAVHEYHDRHRKLPPAVIHDANGKALYSWRVLLLPYVEEADRSGTSSWTSRGTAQTTRSCSSRPRRFTVCRGRKPHPA
jgi:hypothetical protein